MEFVEILNAYSSIGILGLIAVMFILLVYQTFKNNQNNRNKKEDIENQALQNIQTQQAQLLSQIQTQNSIFMQHQTDYIETLIKGVTEGINSHVPSKEETEKISKVSLEIDRVLKHILEVTKADRAALVQYHNGGRNLNKMSFLKMSMTNEQIRPGIKSILPSYKDQFRGIIARWVEISDEFGIVRMDSLEDVKEHDTVMYEFFNISNIKAAYGVKISNTDGYSIGFVTINYESTPTVPFDIIHKELEHQQSTVESLLNIDL